MHKIEYKIDIYRHGYLCDSIVPADRYDYTKACVEADNMQLDHCGNNETALVNKVKVK